ncbi:MAG TPA: FHA domain-containing protein [Planctomycetes bacterium]|nr:FHA domain-containing protein [Planctomycetota bacterium]
MGLPRVRTIGRSRDCDLVIRTSRISRVHCRVTAHRGSWLVRDLDSRNGLWVGGERVASALLKAGDRFVVGDHSVRLGSEGELHLEGPSDPRLVPIGEKIAREVPAVGLLALPLGIVLVLLIFWQEEPSSPGILPETATLQPPMARWQPSDGPEVTSPPAPSSFSTSTGRQYTIEELLAIAEQVEIDRSRRPDVDRSQRVAPPLEEMWNEVTGEGEVIADPGREAPPVEEGTRLPVSPEPSKILAETIAVEEVAAEVPERKGRRGRPGPTSRPGTGLILRPEGTRVPRSTGASLLVITQEGEAIVERYHEPGATVDQLLPIFDELIDHGNAAAADAFLAIRSRALDHVGRLASRVRILTRKYSPYIADLSRLSDAKRREVELGMRLLEMLRGQLQELVEVRDAIEARILDGNYPAFLSRAIEVAFEEKNTDLTDKAIEALRRDRCLEALPALIAHASHPSAKRRKQINDVLKEVTGEHYNNRMEWQQWWQDSRKDGQA